MNDNNHLLKKLVAIQKRPIQQSYFKVNSFILTTGTRR